MPPVPVVTATPDEDYATIGLSVPVGDADTVTVYRRSPSGRYVVVRGAYRAAPTADPFVINDYEAPIGVVLNYFAVTEKAGVESPVAESDDVALLVSDTWLVDLWNPANSVKVIVEAVPQQEYGITESSMYPLMRRTPVVVQNIRQAAQGSMTFVTETDDEARRVRHLFSMGVPVLFQSALQLGVGNLYFSASKVQENRVTRLAQEQARRWQVEWAEVDRPKPEWVIDLTALGYINYADAYAIFEEYDVLAQRNPDYTTLRTTKKGEVGAVAGGVTRPDLTWRGD